MPDGGSDGIVNEQSSSSGAQRRYVASSVAAGLTGSGVTTAVPPDFFRSSSPLPVPVPVPWSPVPLSPSSCPPGGVDGHDVVAAVGAKRLGEGLHRDLLGRVDGEASAVGVDDLGHADEVPVGIGYRERFEAS
ncbi:MAG: hypothetical protein HY830_05945 [Actinobacteria bacterium]|nr:hypothetical protein [Actinomycetota bacterium]